MKVIIDIPEHVKADFDNANISDVDCYVNDYDLLIGRAIKNGTPLDNATNGDIIKTLFPDGHESFGRTKAYYSSYPNWGIESYIDWWNTPYTKE